VEAYLPGDGNGEREDEELQPLDIEELEIAQATIAEFYPLAKVPVWKILPWVFCCAKGLKKSAKRYTELLQDRDGTEAWQQAELTEVDERLDQVIQDAGAPKFEGTDLLKDHHAKANQHLKK